MKKKHIIIIFMLIIIIGSLQIPNLLESTYPFEKEYRTEAFYNIRYLLQGLFSLAGIIFVNIILLVYFMKSDIDK
ncbi:hypothetical protein GW626_09835 [Peribacillus muralis]|uniref:hypothetical protein n=1 Tax=Peribacillus muralis TaxID=264697 RepID=UPI001F4E6CAA|nr:hypothetical protein [Peribacillus muralis]MCK1993635.1 hypothetical protein [Peribacillus muralis]MCK2014077.1 hypothetical protein [Peribacillus muralis]